VDLLRKKLEWENKEKREEDLKKVFDKIAEEYYQETENLKQSIKEKEKGNKYLLDKLKSFETHIEAL